jgi:hypothetical protein
VTYKEVYGDCGADEWKFSVEFFNIFYIMELNLIEKLWLTESRNVLLWSQGFRVRAHKNSPGDAILNRIFQQIIFISVVNTVHKMN